MGPFHFHLCITSETQKPNFTKLLPEINNIICTKMSGDDSNADAQEAEKRERSDDDGADDAERK